MIEYNVDLGQGLSCDLEVRKREGRFAAMCPHQPELDTGWGDTAGEAVSAFMERHRDALVAYESAPAEETVEGEGWTASLREEEEEEELEEEIFDDEPEDGAEA